MTALNEAEKSRNEDLDFEEKNKWKFIKSQILLCPPTPLGGEGGTPLYQVIDTFTSRHRMYYLPIYLFNINFACCHIQKFILAILSWANNES